MAMKRIYTIEELEERIKVWQERLTITDWTISCEFANHAGMSERVGRISIVEYHKRANVQIPSVETYGDAIYSRQDMEFALIHELLHIKLFLIDPVQLGVCTEGQTLHVIFEQIINDLTISLVAGYEATDQLSRHMQDFSKGLLGKEDKEVLA